MFAGVSAEYKGVHTHFPQFKELCALYGCGMLRAAPGSPLGIMLRTIIHQVDHKCSNKTIELSVALYGDNRTATTSAAAPSSTLTAS